MPNSLPPTQEQLASAINHGLLLHGNCTSPLGLQTSQMEDPFVHMSLEVSPTYPDYLLNLIRRHVAYHYLMPSWESIPPVSCFQSIIDTGYDLGLST